MVESTKQQIDQVLSEIESLKSIINQNKTMLYQVSLPIHCRIPYLLMGMVVWVFSFLFYFLTVYHGTYDAIPSHVRGTLHITMVVLGIILLPLMVKLWGDSLKKQNNELSLERALNSLVSFRIFTFEFPVGVIGLVFAIYFYLHIDPYYTIPIFAIIFGLRHILIGCVAENYQWSISGYWFLTTALFVALDPIPAPLAVGLTFGCGFLLLAVSTLLAGKYYG
ncbi:MAG: hypothetical protein GY729_08680 [Desulfobacteraceae bacterium]|nr:hypothetical protein [Desulfobacteraceae bacterium]